MNPVPGAVHAPRTPLVNLLPPEIEQRRAQHRARFIIYIAVLVFAVMLVGAWFIAMTAKSAAESDLLLEQDLTTQKQQQLAQYSYIPGVQAELANSQNARAWVGATDINWATQLSAFWTAVPKNVALTSVVVTGANPSAPSLSDGTVFGVTDYGNLSFSGNASTPILVATFQDAIDALPGFDRTTIQVTSIDTNSDGTTDYWTFSGATRMTDNALSGRVTTSQEIVPVETDSTPAPTATNEGQG